MRFIEKTDCKLSVSNGNVNALGTYKMKSMLLLTLPPKGTFPSKKIHQDLTE